MNKGFTLVELLAVIVILSVLAVITVFTTNTTITNSRSELYEVQIDKIKDAAQIYYLKEGINYLNYNRDESRTCVNINYLTENDYIDASEIINPETNEILTGSIKILYNSNEYIYEYQNSSCSNNDLGIICEAVSTATTGNIPEGNYEIGDEYKCKVDPSKESYTFFVISENNDETVNLILDRNVYYDENTDVYGLTDSSNAGLIEWVSASDYNDDTNYGENGNSNKGPITVFNYLYNATKTWTNLQNMQIEYTDEGNSYGKILTDGNITQIIKKDGIVVTNNTGEEIEYLNLKARLPYKTELYAFDTESQTNLWMYNYLATNSSITGEGLKNITGISGYWTFTSDVSNSENALGLFNNGIVASNYVSDNTYNGVRPVITVFKGEILN